MKSIYVIMTLLLAGFAMAGCGGSDDGTDGSSENGTFKIVATIGMIADVAKNVGGENVEVVGLMGPGVDPHLYKASAGDVTRMSEADLILFNGLHLEGAMSEVLEKVGQRANTYAIAEAVDDSRLLSPSDYKGAHDPHIWFDVSLWMKAVEGIRDKLIELDPDNREAYQKNADKYLAEMNELHQYVLEQASSIPEKQRVLITAHDAFNYFGRAYGFQVRGLQGISTASEAGTADVQNLADFIANNRIPAIFVESSVPVRNIEAVQAAVKSRGFGVKIGGELFSDAMGTSGTPEGTYLGMVRHNIDTIVSSLKPE